MPAKPSSGYAYLTTPTHKHTPTHPHTYTHTHAQIDETIHSVGDSPATLLGNLFLFFLSPRHFTCCLLLDWLLSSSSSFGALPLHLLPFFTCFTTSVPPACLPPCFTLPPARAELNFHFHFASGVSCRPLPPLPPPCLLCPRPCCCVCPC